MNKSKKQLFFTFMPFFLGIVLLINACGLASDAQIAAAKKLMDEKKFSEAIAQLNKVLETTPENSEAANLRGIAHLETKNLSKAVLDFDKAIKNDATQYKYFYNRGNAKLELKDYEAAKDDFNKSIALDATVSDVYLGRGSAFLYLNRVNEALADYNQGLKLSPSDKNLLFNRAMAFANLKNYQGALHDLHECIGIDANFAKAHFYLALFHLEVDKKENEEICEHLNQAAKLGFEKAIDMLKDFCK